jgi:PucR C-terminal helix-turn-helix domain/GAF domain/GGDEF-like domain
VVTSVAARADAEARPDPALAAAVEAAARLPGADIAGVLLTDDAGATATMHACAGKWTLHSLDLRVRRGHGLAGRILQTRRPWKVDDYTCDRSIKADEFALILADDGTRAGLGAPMLAGDELVGVLMAWSRRPHAFDVTTTQAMVTLAELAALAVVDGRRAQAAERELALLAARCDELAECVAARGRSAAFRDELAELLITGCETTALLAAVCVHTGGDAALFDHALGELAACGAAGPIRDRIAGQADGVLAPGPGLPRWTLVRAVVADGLPLARLALCLPHPPTAADHDSAAHAATACALHLARERAVVDARARVHADFVWQLLEGLVDEAVAVVRARQLGCELPARLRVAVVPIAADADEQRLDVLATAAERAAAAAGASALAGRRDTTLALVLDSEDPTVTRSVVGEVVQALRRHVPIGAAGVSACVDWSADLRDAYRQARQAIEASAFAPDGPAVLFDELGLLRFLLAPSDRADQLRFARAVLGPALDYDRDHQTQLVTTLGAWLDGGGSLTRTAAALYVHPKTVRYRLRRVEELTRRDLSAQRDRFDAQLAITILRALALGQDESFRFS